MWATLEEDLLAHEQVQQTERIRLLKQIEDEMDRLERAGDRWDAAQWSQRLEGEVTLTPDEQKALVDDSLGWHDQEQYLLSPMPLPLP